METELSLSSGEMKKEKMGPKDINDNEAFEPQIVVRDTIIEAGRGKSENANLPSSTQLMEMVAGKSVALPIEASPEEKLSKGKNLAESKEEVEMKSLDDRDSRLSKPNRDVSDEKPLTRERNDMAEDEKMKVEEEKLRVGEESSDCLSSSSRRALKRTAQITPPPGKDTTKV